jgi:hypothetical protein
MFRSFFRKWGSLVAGLRTAWRPLPAMLLPPRDCRSAPRSHLDDRLASERGIRPTRIVRKHVKGRVARVALPAKDDGAARLPSPWSVVPGGRRRLPLPRRACQEPLSVRPENRMCGVCAPRATAATHRAWQGMRFRRGLRFREDTQIWRVSPLRSNGTRESGRHSVRWRFVQF